MGISRDRRHKRRKTGGRMSSHKKKRAYEQGRPPANTKLGLKKIRKIRIRGGKHKLRALALNAGNYNWQSEGVTLKTKILNVVYNASNNDLVRTNTLVKNTIVLVDAAPFSKYLVKHYFGAKGDTFELQFDWEKQGETDLSQFKDKDKEMKFVQRRMATVIDPRMREQIKKGQILACISSRPGQSGRVDGYLLEGKELEFYQKKVVKK